MFVWYQILAKKNQMKFNFSKFKNGSHLKTILTICNIQSSELKQDRNQFIVEHVERILL